MRTVCNPESGNVVLSEKPRNFREIRLLRLGAFRLSGLDGIVSPTNEDVPPPGEFLLEFVWFRIRNDHSTFRQNDSVLSELVGCDFVVSHERATFFRRCDFAVPKILGKRLVCDHYF